MDGKAMTAAGGWTERLNEVMPWGSSTCSKAPVNRPEEPGVIVRGAGCRVWDDGGREFIDFRNGLGPVTLGYRYPAVDEAIKKQLESGMVFGHPHPLECEVAEMIRDVVPCAEQVRFLKTGGEAIAACIRLARAYTGREHVIQVGYNGWLNGLAADARVLPGQTARSGPAGVPRGLSELHHGSAWGDVEGMRRLLEEYDGRVAAVVIAADYAGMAKGKEFYPAVRELTRKAGTVLIYDEIVTGFRIAVAGVQEYFGVTPDMAVFAKGVANGMPLSVYAGRRDIMQEARRAIVSTTYGGEALSLAAAKATIETYRTRDVVGHLWRQGEKLWGAVNRMMRERCVGVRVEGLWPCPQFVFTEGVTQETFFRSAYRNGLSLYNVSYVNFSHGDADVEEAVRRFERVADELKGVGR